MSMEGRWIAAGYAKKKPQPGPTCEAPKIVAVQAQDKAAYVKWTYDGVTEPKYFTIYANEGTTEIKQNIDSPNIDAIVTGLTNSKQYTITMTATGYNNKPSAKSNSMKVTPAPPVIPAPVFKTLVAGDGKATGTFDPVTPPQGYTIDHYSFIAIDQHDAEFRIEEHVQGGPSVATFTPLENDRDYSMTLVAVTTDGYVSAESNALPVSPSKPIAPYPPEILGASVDAAGHFTVQWEPGFRNGSTGPLSITAWRVHRVSKATTADQDMYDITDGDQRKLTESSKSLASGKHTLEVQAKNSVGWSEWSPTVTITYDPSNEPPFKTDVTVLPYETATYHYAKFDPGNDPKTGWDRVWNFTRTTTGQNTDIEVAIIGSGGGGKGQTISLGKGGDGGGGDQQFVSLPTPGKASAGKVVVSIGGTTAIDPRDSQVTEGSETFTATSGKSATDKNDAVGTDKKMIPESWKECPVFNWHTPQSYYTGGVALSGQQGYPDGFVWGEAGAGTKAGKPGQGESGVVIFRWKKDQAGPVTMTDPTTTEKKRRKWFGRK